MIFQLIINKHKVLNQMANLNLLKKWHNRFSFKNQNMNSNNIIFNNRAIKRKPIMKLLILYHKKYYHINLVIFKKINTNIT